jgi:hypothetical protein
MVDPRGTQSDRVPGGTGLLHTGSQRLGLKDDHRLIDTLAA